MSEQVKAPALDLSKYIETRWFQDRPHIRGRRVPVATLAADYPGNGSTVAQVAYNYTLSEEQVLAALLYYAEHRAEIDAQEAAHNAVTPEEWMKYGENAVLLRRNDTPSSGE